VQQQIRKQLRSIERLSHECRRHDQRRRDLRSRQLRDELAGRGGIAGSADNSGAAASEPPSYPGAMTQAAGSSSNMGQTAAGKVLMSDDSFDKVYQWYQQNMPAGSEKSHVTAPIQSAVFMIGDPGKGQTSVTITTSGTKTMIAIAHVKM
jgi:hypothetical protein